MWRAINEPVDLAGLTAALVGGANTAALDGAGCTVLHVLSARDPVPGCFVDNSPASALRRILCFEGVDVNARDRNNGSPLHLAAALDHPQDTMATLLVCEADVHAINYWGRTPLHCAKTAAAVNMLLAHGADPCARDVDGCTTLRHAGRHTSALFLLELLRHPGVAATMHVADAVGMTPLHAAARAVHPHDCMEAAAVKVSALLQHGADGSAEDIYGNTPIDYASWRLQDVASARPRVVEQAGEGVAVYDYARGDTPPLSITPAQQAAALKQHLLIARQLWWHRRRPALSAFAHLRWGRAAPAAAATTSSHGSGNGVTIA